MRYLMIIVLLLVFLLVHAPVFAEQNGVDMQINLLPWEIVDELLPKNSKFTVMDVETGKSFNVQRRAGSRHADVQPLTAKDTKIMKGIYDGTWSWKRRAILVIYENQWIAASMHGMPHGAGKLNNNFPGHFCVHFYGSKTHRTNDMDLSHKLMTLKAAGKLQAYLENSDPFEIVQAFVAGMQQHDQMILSLVSLQNTDWKKKLNQIENIKLLRMEVTVTEELTSELSLKVPVAIEWHDSETGKELFDGHLYLFRSSPTDAWKVDNRRFLEESCLLQHRKKCEAED